jgi:peptidoglycan/LPS O-acetylase OafA/YrhL
MINQITFTRFLAAFIIVFYHMGENLFKNISPSFEILRKNLDLGVSYFFVLSGFVMIIAYNNKKVDFKKFMINRLSRIYPTHLLALFLTLLVSLFVSINYINHYTFDGKGFLLQAFLLQAWIPSYSLSWNVPSWSISVELFFYVMFPLLINTIFRNKNKKVVISLIFTIWVIAQIVMNIYYFSPYYLGEESISWYFLYFNPVPNFSSFLMGCLGGYIYTNQNTMKIKNYDIHIIIICIVTIVFVLIGKQLLLHNGLLAINFLSIIFLLSLNNGYITKIFNHRVFIHLGEISFALYILQNPVFIFLKKINNFVGIQNDYLFFIIGVIILLYFSHLTYTYFEKPLQIKIKKITNKSL